MTEDKVEQDSLEKLASLGWQILHGPEIGPDGSGERKYTDVVLENMLKFALSKINPIYESATIGQAVTKIVRSSDANLLLDNKNFHEMLFDGIDIESRVPGSEDVRTVKVNLFDFEHPENNEFVAVNQLTVMQGDYHRRPDVVLFVNGMPLGIIELKDPSNEKASLKAAYQQLQTYKAELPALFRFNELMIISDGIDAAMGTISSSFERFVPWKTIDGSKELTSVPMLEVLLRGACDKRRMLDIVRSYIVFERDEEKHSYIKKIAAYHQYWAVNKALDNTRHAILPESDHRVGVVWHTQGSGKSLSMMFYSGKLVLDPVLENPTIIVITDRNDLDDQLYGTFANCKDLLRQDPVQANSRNNLQELLERQAGGIIFTTNAKFFPEEGNDYPELSDRRNIIVMADEAHRSQYNFIDGFAKHIRQALPNASFIGFTGTPIENDDRSTPAVFGKYIDVYDIQQSVKDGATVPIYYESRLVELDINKDMRSKIDQEIDQLLQAEEFDKQEEYKTRNAQLEAIVGNAKRIDRIASDIVEHFENRLSTIVGKGMVVVMSRRIAVDLYNLITSIRPDWHNAADDKGFIKVIMTGSASDPLDWQQHIRNKERRGKLAERMKESESDLKLVIVCDMWLTGFDAPSLHTMYLDKPMKGHNLMQAIARINRVYNNKPGGLVVDYLGIAAALREALETYTVSGGKGSPFLNQAEAVAVMKEKFEILQDLFTNFDYEKYFPASTGQQLQILLDAQEYILGLEDGEKRLKQHVLELSKAFALSVPHPDALAIRDHVAFFQAIKARLGKISVGPGGMSSEDYNAAIRQIVDKAIAPAGVVDIFEAAGLERPNLSILSEEFLAEIRGMDRKNLAIEALQRLLNDEVRTRFSTNAIKARSFADMLDRALQKYKNNSIEAAQIIEELIDIARKMRDSNKEAEELGMTADEVAFYDALAMHGAAREVMGDDQLRKLAALLVKRVKANTSVDWTFRADAQARLRVEVKRLLREYSYPPDEEKLATDLVLEQASLFGEEWSK
ncbi:MAG: type I restriction endonuclease subunit R [Candidatus Saccharibacteria bacterium]